MRSTIIDKLREELPSMFTRVEASKFLGGLYSAASLANMDSQQRGPGGLRVGKKVVYEKDIFLSWLEGKLAASSCVGEIKDTLEN